MRLFNKRKFKAAPRLRTILENDKDKFKWCINFLSLSKILTLKQITISKIIV